MAFSSVCGEAPARCPGIRIVVSMHTFISRRDTNTRMNRNLPPWPDDRAIKIILSMDGAPLHLRKDGDRLDSESYLSRWPATENSILPGVSQEEADRFLRVVTRLKLAGIVDSSAWSTMARLEKLSGNRKKEALEALKPRIISSIVQRDPDDAAETWLFVRYYYSKDSSFFSSLARAIENPSELRESLIQSVILDYWSYININGHPVPGLAHWSDVALAEFLLLKTNGKHDSAEVYKQYGLKKRRNLIKKLTVLRDRSSSEKLLGLDIHCTGGNRYLIPSDDNGVIAINSDVPALASGSYWFIPDFDDVPTHL